jgi:hypothetical protein
MEALALHKELARKLTELEKKIEGHDTAIQSLFEAIPNSWLRLSGSPSPKSVSTSKKVQSHTERNGNRHDDYFTPHPSPFLHVLEEADSWTDGP